MDRPKAETDEGEAKDATAFLLPLREKVDRPEAETDEGEKVDRPEAETDEGEAKDATAFLLPLREKVDRPEAETDEGKAKDARLRGFAKHLRREGTEAERSLWRLLRGRRFMDHKFRRQVPIEGYIVDFMCYSARLIVELDGSQHADSARDAKRDAKLMAQGFRILRIWNNELTENRQGVLEAVWAALVAHPSSGPSDHLLPQGEKEGRGA